MPPAIERTEPVRTAIVPQVVLTPAFPPLSAGPPDPAAPERSALRIVLTWAAFGVLAAAVITGTTLWSASLRVAPSLAPPSDATIDTVGVMSTSPRPTTAPTAPRAATSAPPAPAAAAPPAATPPVVVRVAPRRAAPPVVRRPVVPAPAPVVAPPVVDPAPVVPAPAVDPQPVATDPPTVDPTTTNCGSKKRKSTCDNTVDRASLGRRGSDDTDPNATSN